MRIYFPKIGDRLVVSKYCRNVLKKNVEDSSESETEKLDKVKKIERAIEIFNSKTGKKRTKKSQEPQRTKTSQINKEKETEEEPKNKKQKKADFGWMHRTTSSSNYIDLTKYAGGVKSMNIDGDKKRDDVVELVSNKFFEGKKLRGFEKGFEKTLEKELLDKVFQPVENLTFSNILKDRDYKSPKFYLATTGIIKKTEPTSTVTRDETISDFFEVTVAWMNQNVIESDTFDNVQEVILKIGPNQTADDIEKEFEKQIFPSSVSLLGPKEAFTVLGLYIPNTDEVVSWDDLLNKNRRDNLKCLEWRTLRFERRMLQDHSYGHFSGNSSVRFCFSFIFFTAHLAKQ